METNKTKKNDEEYLVILNAMKSMAATRIQGGLEEWNSFVTNRCIKLILDRMGVTETFTNLIGNSEISDEAYKVIMINDLLGEFSVEDIMVMIYYTFDIVKYNKIITDISDNAVQSVYGSLSERLNLLIMKIVSKFTIDNGISPLVKKGGYIANEMQARILLHNNLASIENICRYGNLYSEEFTDMIIDHILLNSMSIVDSNKRREYLENIYTLLDKRINIPSSYQFKEKNKEVIRQVCKIHISMAYSLESVYTVTAKKEKDATTASKYKKDKNRKEA